MMTPETLALLVCSLAPVYDIKVETAAAIIEVESSWRLNARGPAGEIGPFQLHPRFYPVPPTDYKLQVVVALEKLRGLKRRLSPVYGDAWIVAYNYGETGLKALDQPTRTRYYQRIQKAKAQARKRCST